MAAFLLPSYKKTLRFCNFTLKKRKCQFHPKRKLLAQDFVNDIEIWFSYTTTGTKIYLQSPFCKLNNPNMYHVCPSTANKDSSSLPQPPSLCPLRSDALHCISDTGMALYQTWKMSETLPEQDCSFLDFTQKCVNYVWYSARSPKYVISFSISRKKR